jgi:hypothetical protein
MDPFIFGLIVGFGGGVAAMIVVIRRAKAKPQGNTAKVVTIMGGGGPDPLK